MKRFVLILAMTVLPFAPAFGQVGLGAICEGDSVRIHVEVYMNSFNEEPEGHSIIVQADILGTCEPGFIIPVEPFPMPEFMTSATFEFVVANPDPSRYFRYLALGRDPDGQTYFLPPAGDVRAYAFCGGPDAVVARGYLLSPSSGYHEFEPCPNSCWYATEYTCPVILFETEPGWEIFVNSGQLVNLYGRGLADGMPGAACVMISRVEPEMGELGCQSVSASKTSWGSIKARYR